MKPIALLLILSLLLALGCTPRASTTASPEPLPEAPAGESTAMTYVGEYDVTVSDTPAGTVTGTLMITEVDGDLTGSFVAGGSSTELQSVSTTDDGLRINFYSAQYQTDVNMNLKGAPGAATLSGTTLGSYRTVATRK